MEKLAIIDGCIDIEVHSCLKTSTKDITKRYLYIYICWFDQHRTNIGTICYQFFAFVFFIYCEESSLKANVLVETTIGT